MLMRFAKVEPNGTYSAPPVAKANYATMVYVRAGMVYNAGETLAKAVTIATRFSVVRRQGEAVKNRARRAGGGGGTESHFRPHVRPR